MVRIGAPSLCSGATRTLVAPGAAHHVCLLQSVFVLGKQQFPVAAGLSHGSTGPPAMAARRTLHHAALSRFVHVLFTLFCGRSALVLRRAAACTLPACGGGGSGGGASAAFLGCIIARLLKARTSYLYLGSAAPRVVG